MTQPPKLASILDPRRLVDDAIERLYRVAASDASWPEALAAIALAHGAHRAILFTPGVSERDGGLCVAHESIPPGFLKAVNAPNASKGEPEVSCSIAISTENGGDAETPMALLALFRPSGQAQFSAEQRQSFEVCGRHAATALRLWYRARVGRLSADALANSLNAAALLVDAEARILWMNARASLWIETARIAVVQGRIAEVRGFPMDLARAIRDGAERRRGAMVQVAQGLTLEIVAAIPFNAGRLGEPRALLILRDRNGQRQAAAALAGNYRLTSSEVDLAMALWRGMLLAEYAVQRNVAMSTVRTQLKALLSKTGARRQSDIVAIVAGLQPIVLDDALPNLIADGHSIDRDIPHRIDPSNG